MDSSSIRISFIIKHLESLPTSPNAAGQTERHSKAESMSQENTKNPETSEHYRCHGANGPSRDGDGLTK
jgi:hypothetical protein